MTRLSHLIHIDLECRSAWLLHRHLYSTPWDSVHQLVALPLCLVNVKTAEPVSAVLSGGITQTSYTRVKEWN